MKNKDLRKRKLQKLRDSSFFYEETSLPEAQKDIDEIVKELNNKLAEQRKIIEENDKKILETMSYEELLNDIRLLRVRLPGFSQ